MTRVTNFGIKRTYVQAGFADVAEPAIPESEKPTVSEPSGPLDPPPKKKRKRTKPSKRDGNKAKAVAEGNEETETNPAAQPETSPNTAPAPKSKSKTKKSKRVKPAYVSPQEARRLKRIEERNATTICFACRLKGHSARDCPSSGDKSKNAVGICYRCGSSRHTLARCKKPVNSDDPLPFASCFVCTKSGHLASACPQNVSKGIYPNGGCCKLCGETSHLAKDCGLRKQDSAHDSGTLGVGREVGADEDDFHILRRRKAEVDSDEKQQEKMKHNAEIKIAPHSGSVKPFVNPAVKKNVVFF
ncbi:hypothetical protein R3P38DRAFT_2970183 [Favolaschia claudopus]|uniref:CCHC-type domain-containing protein n=1 Tax=Favolaschia claudopus TaxID=2862362 RepID=A0AAW0B4V9_9AGAR